MTALLDAFSSKRGPATAPARRPPPKDELDDDLDFDQSEFGDDTDPPSDR